MKSPFFLPLTAALLLGACGGGGSGLNPLNWFRPSAEETLVLTAPAPGTEIADPRPLVAQVTELRIEPSPGGVILHAVGLPERQGYWQAALLAENDGKPADGVLVLQFRAAPPPGPTGDGPPRSRQLTVATFLSDQALLGVKTIVVKSAQNQRTIRP